MKNFLKRHLGKLALAGFILASVGVGVVTSQTNPTLQNTLKGTEQVNIRDPAGATDLSATTSALRNTSGWVYEAPLTGVTLVMTGNQSVVSINPAGTIAAHTVTLPPLPPDGFRVEMYSTQIITALTINTSDSSTFTPAVVTTLGANGSVAYVYDRTNSVWHRFQ